MLVPSMTLQEIRKEFEKDYPILRRKIQYVTHDLTKKLNRYTKSQGFINIYDYYSKNKNHWLYRLNISDKDKKQSVMMLYHNGKGNVAISILGNLQMVYHTGHFFERYNERNNLGLSTFKDIVKAYMNETFVIDFKTLDEIAPGIFKVFCIIPSGVALGMFNEKINMVKTNTFLTNSMLSQNQLKLKEELKNELDKYEHSSDRLE